ncbi:HNH endonuclease signature motif containing protein [Nocardia sp. CC216A]|uniref:HNH endonuclease signature motif containing protein n=1 Tax=Nocardia sp. CC216A TaxID=3044158 RepID=UPI0027958FF9|nr:HNH endonuclease signature motif containing protein [Nocardia sp. CC216A]
MNPGGAGEVFAVVEELTTATTALLDEDLTRYTDTDFVELMRRVEAVRARLGAVSHRLVIETSDRHLPERAGCKSLAKYLSETLRISMAEAGARRRAAQKLGVFHFVHGEDREPEYPHTAAQQAAGLLSVEHARRIMTVMDRIPAAVPTELRVEAEQLLARHACELTPDAIVTVGESILAHLDPDGTLTDDRDRARVRGITVGRQRIDGMTEISGLLTPQLRALLDAVLAKGARPGMCNSADPDSPTLGARAIDPKTLEAAAERDTRTIAQRNHDALTAFLTATGGAKTLGSHRGMPVSVVLTMRLEDLERGTGHAVTAAGTTMSIPAALRLAAGRYPWLLLFGRDGVPLYLGRGQRLASRWQRLACVARDRGCTFPGCDAPATMCAVHHLIPWAHHGGTDIDNLTLVCDRHHAQVAEDPDDPTGWATERLDTHTRYPGRTGWRPPTHHDPARGRRVNHRHHGDELLGPAIHRLRVKQDAGLPPPPLRQ